VKSNCSDAVPLAANEPVGSWAGSRSPHEKEHRAHISIFGRFEADLPADLAIMLRASTTRSVSAPCGRMTA
jgi:hypothetical protein